MVGELDGRARSAWRALARDLGAEVDRATCSATCGPRRPTGRCCSPPRSRTSRSPTRWPSRATARCSSGWPARCWPARRRRRSRSTASTPQDLDGSIDRLVAFNRRSAKTHSGIYRDLAVRKRPVEPLLDGARRAAGGPHAGADPRDRGRPARVRGGQPRAAGRARPDGGGGRAERGDHAAGARRARGHRAAARRGRGGQGQHRRARRRDHELLHGGRAAAGRRATPPVVTRLREAGGRAAVQGEPARVRRGQRQPGLRDDLQPAPPRPDVRRVEQRVGRAGGRGRVRLRAGHGHRRLDPHPRRVLRDRRASSRRSGSCRVDGRDRAVRRRSTTSGR